MKLDKKTVSIIVLLIVAFYLLTSRRTSGFGAHDCPQGYTEGHAERCYKCPNGMWLAGSNAVGMPNGDGGSMCCRPGGNNRRGTPTTICDTNPLDTKSVSWYLW